MGTTLYTSRVVLRVLGEVDYGLYNVVGGLVTMFTFLNGSLGAATSRYITFELGKKNSDGVNRVFNVALVIHVMLALLIIALAETVGLWFFYEKMTIPDSRMDAAFWVYQISIVTCFFSLTQVPYNAMIIAHEDMRVYAWVGIAEAAFKLAVAFVIMASPFDVLVYYALLLCAVQVIIMLFYRFYCNRHFKESRIRLYRDKALYKEMFSFGGADLIGNLSVLAQGQGLNLLLNMFFGPAVNAARGIAYQVQGAVTQFGNNFMTAVKPQIIKSYAEGDVEGMMRLVKDSSCFSFYLMWLICLCPGYAMASGDRFEIYIEGKSGHGASPEECIDATVVGAAIVMNLQTIVSRELLPMNAAIVTVGSLESGNRYNVISGKAKLTGTVRTFKPEVREYILKRIEEIAKGTAETLRAKAGFKAMELSPCVKNDPTIMDIVWKASQKVMGENSPYNNNPTMGCEDFAYFQQKVPGVMAFPVIRNEACGACWAQHSSQYNVDESALIKGAGLYVQTVLDFLKS